MSDLEFWDTMRREAEPWFDGRDMERIESVVRQVSDRFAGRPPDFMPREEWEARNRFAINKPWWPNRQAA